MRVIDECSFEHLPASAFIYTDAGRPISEFSPINGRSIIAGLTCASVACDNHLSSLLINNISEAPIDAVYTKRWLTAEENSIVQRHAHLTEGEYIKYVNSLCDLSEFKGSKVLLLGGFSWQGLMLASLAGNQIGEKCEHLLVSGNYTSDEIRGLSASVEECGVSIISVEKGTTSPASRYELMEAVDAAIENIRLNYDLVLNPSSSTLELAKTIAAIQGTSLRSIKNVKGVFNNLTQREIEIFGRLVFKQETCKDLQAIQLRLAPRLMTDTYDVLMLAAQALEFYVPNAMGVE